MFVWEIANCPNNTMRNSHFLFVDRVYKVIAHIDI